MMAKIPNLFKMAALVLGIALFADGSAVRAEQTVFSGSWVGEWSNDQGGKSTNSKLTFTIDLDRATITGDWDGFRIENLRPEGNQGARWNHYKDGKTYDVICNIEQGGKVMSIRYFVYKDGVHIVTGSGRFERP